MPNVFSMMRIQKIVIEGIKRFPAGHYGWVRHGRLNIKRWWCTLDHLVKVPSRYEEQSAIQGTVLGCLPPSDAKRCSHRHSPERRARSSATISVMAYLGKNRQSERMERDWQHAFVAAFPGTPLDETGYARMVTDHIGIDATMIDIDPLKAWMTSINIFICLRICSSRVRSHLC